MRGKVEIETVGFRVEDLGAGNGDCGYRAGQPFPCDCRRRRKPHAGTAQADALWSRPHIVLHVQKHRARFGELLAKDINVPPEDVTPQGSIQDWLKSAGQQGAWIDGVALQAMSEKRGIPIVICGPCHEGRGTLLRPSSRMVSPRRLEKPSPSVWCFGTIT